MKNVVKDEQEATCTWSMEIAPNGGMIIIVNGEDSMYFRTDGRAFRPPGRRYFWGSLGFKTTDEGAIKFEDEV